MIISIRVKNFFSLRDDVVLDFTADIKGKRDAEFLDENFIDFAGDKFVNVIGLFGSNAAGKSNLIKTVAFCRNLILTSHLNNEGDKLNYEPFKFGSDYPSEFYMDFVAEGIEYEYSFALYNGEIVSEELYYYPNKRKSKIFTRENTYKYSFKKGVIQRPSEVEANTGSKTLFLSRASSMNREIAKTIYRFFLNQMVFGIESVNLSDFTADVFDKYKKILLRGLEVSDSDIVDIRLIENAPGQSALQSYHKEDPKIAFDFIREESEGTKRLFALLLLISEKATDGVTFFFDEFDLKLHLRLAEFVINLIKSSNGSQMVFTSHNPLLLNKDNLRPEQIVFVDKNSEGSSELTPLSDYEPLGKNTDFMEAYLQGRFDAVPYIGSAREVFENQD